MDSLVLPRRSVTVSRVSPCVRFTAITGVALGAALGLLGCAAPDEEKVASADGAAPTTTASPPASGAEGVVATFPTPPPVPGDTTAWRDSRTGETFLFKDESPEEVVRVKGLVFESVDDGIHLRETFVTPEDLSERVFNYFGRLYPEIVSELAEGSPAPKPQRVADFRVPTRASGPEHFESSIIFRFRGDAAALSDHLDGPVLLAGATVGGLPLHEAESFSHSGSSSEPSRTRIVRYADSSGDYDPEVDQSFELQSSLLAEGGRHNEQFLTEPYEVVVPGLVGDWQEEEGSTLIARVGPLTTLIEASWGLSNAEWKDVLTTIGTAPFITVTGRPDAKDPASTARFEWTTTGGEPRSTKCKLDGGPFEPCTSGHELAGLDVGRHSFEVQVETEGGIDTKRIDWTRS